MHPVLHYHNPLFLWRKIGNILEEEKNPSFINTPNLKKVTLKYLDDGITLIMQNSVTSVTYSFSCIIVIINQINA